MLAAQHALLHSDSPLAQHRPVTPEKDTGVVLVAGQSVNGGKAYPLSTLAQPAPWPPDVRAAFDAHLGESGRRAGRADSDAAAALGDLSKLF